MSKTGIETHLYVLELENDNYYVGITSREPQERLREHLSKGGSKWTQEHPVEGLYSLKRNVPNPKKAERWATLLMMKLKGWRNVRGGGWTRVDLPSKPAPLSQLTLEDLEAKFATEGWW